MIHCSRKTLDTSVIFQWRLWVFFLKVSSSLSDGSYSPQGQMNFFPFCAKVWKPTGLSFSFLWCEVYQEHNILISYFSGKIFSWLPKRVFPSCRKKKKKKNIPNNVWVDQGRAEHLFQKHLSLKGSSIAIIILSPLPSEENLSFWGPWLFCLLLHSGTAWTNLLAHWD